MVNSLSGANETNSTGGERKQRGDRMARKDAAGAVAAMRRGLQRGCVGQMRG